MPNISEAQRALTYQKALHISWKKPEGGGKLVILNLNDGDFFSLEDPVSMSVWEQLLSDQTPAAISSDLAAQYPDQDPAVLREDVDRFVGELLEGGLVCACGDNGAKT